MLSVEDWKKVLSSKGNKYTDEEVAKIREFLYDIARVELEEKGKNERVYKKS